MNQDTLSPANFPSIFSQMVSEAAMELPPLTREEDFEFLRSMLAVVMEAFWNNYLSLLPETARDEYVDAMNGETADGVMQWMVTYANFKEDEKAEQLGKRVLEDISLKLPQTIKEEYASFKSSFVPES